MDGALIQHHMVKEKDQEKKVKDQDKKNPWSKKKNNDRGMER